MPVKENSNLKNTAKSSAEFFALDDDLQLLRIATEAEEQERSMNLEKGFIYFFFCVEGSVVFAFSPHYTKALSKGNNFFYYNPEKDAPVALLFASGVKWIALKSSISKLHQLFLENTPELAFLSNENINRKFYEERPIDGKLLAPLNQMFSVQLSEYAQKVFFKGKVYEIFGLYFSHEPESDMESCPFLKDEDQVRKIKAAKDALLKDPNHPPSLKELARQVGVNEYRLKTGFKEIYGNTVFGYLLDYKLENSRAMLDSGKYQVNEVAFSLGYSNPSHYITAFKKKFGVTPKKYISNR